MLVPKKITLFYKISRSLRESEVTASLMWEVGSSVEDCIYKHKYRSSTFTRPNGLFFLLLLFYTYSHFSFSLKNIFSFFSYHNLNVPFLYHNKSRRNKKEETCWFPEMRWTSLFVVVEFHEFCPSPHAVITVLLLSELKGCLTGHTP